MRSSPLDTPEAPAALRPPPTGMRRARPVELGTRAAALLGIVLLLAAGVWVHRRVAGDEAARAAARATQTESGGSELVARAAAVSDHNAVGVSDAGAARWRRELTMGAQSPTSLLLRVFTATSYLVAEHNDRAFARDLYEVRVGEPPSGGWLDRADVFFAKGGSRVSLLQTVPEIPAIAAPEGSVRAFAVTAGFPRIDRVTIGTAVAAGQCRLDHVQARLMLYVNGHLRSDTLIDTSDQTFEVTWDTREEKPGGHDVAVLLRSSDGRGRVVEKGSFTVPRTVELADERVYDTQLVGHEQWYYLTPATRDVLFNAHLAEGDLALRLYDLEGRLLLATDNRGDAHETLRYRGENDRVYYARVRRGTAPGAAGQSNTDPVSYTVTTADLSARLLATDEIFAVRSVDEVRQSLVVVDHAGAEHSYPAAEVELIAYTGRLSALEILLPDGSPAGLYPDFDRETGEYGLYLPAETPLDRDGLRCFIEAQEGEAAALTVTHNMEGGIQERLPSDGMWAPARSENRLSIEVTGYDGSSRTYTVYVLYSPHTRGYDAETLHGFPVGYRSGLWLLHNLHPDYRYEPFDTGIDWADFIAVQDAGGRSLVQSGRVLDSWVVPDSPVYDGTAWKAAARPVIEHYADPRNFLRQESLFQFERLDFNTDVQTQDGIRAILRGTFMETRLDFYTDLFMRAGENAGISPYFLASRAVQEMGSTGESPLAHGTLPGYEGYYNFFNIGSYPNPAVPDGQRINGALFAMYGNDPEEQEITPDEAAVLLPWDTAEKAIVGGAVFIADRYVAAGQNTLYFQKFDVIPENGLYTRQYAQNIQMAWAEGRRYYTAYREIGLEDAAFVFRIPFYNDMPATPVRLLVR